MMASYNCACSSLVQALSVLLCSTLATCMALWANDERPSQTSRIPNGHLELQFHSNNGQYPPQVRYVGNLGTLLIAVGCGKIELFPPSGTGEPLGLEWIEPSASLSVEAESETGALFSRFSHAPRENWSVEKPVYRRVRFRNLYDGIDLVLYANGGELEFDYEIAAERDPGLIRWRPSRPARRMLQPDASLEYFSGTGSLRMRSPVAFQDLPQGRRLTRASFRCDSEDRCGFEVGPYVTSSPLVIDPVLLYSTYYGEALFDQANIVVTDIAGNIYLIGETWSTGLAVVNGIQVQRSAGKDVFVARFSSNGLTLTASTYFGGTGDDIPTAARMVGSDLTIVGETTSLDLPGSAGTIQPGNRGGKDGFIARIRFSAPCSLVAVTYLGGFANDRISALALDLAGNVYVAGYTASANFPVTVPSFGSGYAGGATDAFVARLNSSLTLLQWSGILGGTGADRADAIALGSDDSVWFGGSTSSSSLPLLNATQSGLLGAFDCFLARTSNDGTTLQFSTYLGGSSSDNCYAMALASNGDPVVAGSSASTDFPVTAGTFQTARRGSYDNFVARLNAQTNTIASATYLGGTETEAPTALYVDTDGAFCLAGYTLSTDFPMQTPTQATNAGSVDGFLSCLSSDGASLLFSTYLGGSGEDRVHSVARRTDTWTVAAGVTHSTNFPVTSNAIQTTARGSGDFFLTAINRSGGNVPPANVSVSPANGSTETAELTYLIEDLNGYQDVKFFYALIHNVISTVGGCYILYNPDLNLIYLLNDDGRTWVGSAAPGQNATLANSQCVIDAARSSAWGHGMRMSIRLFYSFRPGFGGAKSLLMYTQDRANVVAGWQLRGGWSVPQLAGNVQPAVDYLAPNSGSFLSTAFVVRAVDQNGANDLKDLHLLVNDTLTYPNACYVLYNQNTNRLQLLNDSTSQFLGPVTPGVAGTLENSSCILSSAYTSAVKSGNTLTLTAYLSFKSAAAGANNVWTLVSDQSSAFLGWRSQGSITVPIGGAYSRPVAQSIQVLPEASGLRFTLTASDENGSSDIKDLYLLTNETLSNPNGCYLLFRQTTNQIFLLNDAGTAWLGSGTAGSSVTLENSQCSINLAAVSFSQSGTSVQVSTPIAFKPAFTGTKSAWMYVEDLAKLISGWVFLNTFNPPSP